MHWKKSQNLYTNKLIDPEMLVRNDSKGATSGWKGGNFLLDHGGLVTQWQMLHWQVRQTGVHTLHHCQRMETITLIWQILQVNM